VRDHDLGHLERDRSPVPDDLRAHLHQPVTEGCHRPMADLIGQGRFAEEIGEVVGQGIQLQPHGIGGEAAAGQAGLDDRVLPLLDVLLRRTSPIVEQCHRFRRPAHVGHNEPDARIQRAGVPVDVRYHPAGPFPGRRLMVEAGVVTADITRWASHPAASAASRSVPAEQRWRTPSRNPRGPAAIRHPLAVACRAPIRQPVAKPARQQCQGQRSQ